MTFTLVLIHLGVATLWLGGMTYSLFVVQPRVPRVLPDPAEAEEIYRELATGNRWRVVALIAVLALSGLGLAFVYSGHGSPGERWWILVAVKIILLGAASVAFWWVSWRGWPRRIFALPAELPAEQARFRWVALGMAALVGTAFLLGVVARFVR